MANVLPEMCFSGNITKNWELWKARLENYLSASEIDKKPNKVQCALFLLYIGQEGYRIFTTFNLKANEENSEETLKQMLQKFDKHFAYDGT